jgi:starch synthase
MIDSGVNGLLVPPRDPAALAGAILDVLEDPAAARRRAEAARASVRAFDLAATVAATAALYRDLVGHERVGRA